MTVREYLIGALLSLPICVFAECEAKVLPEDRVADVQHKLSCFAAENAELKQRLHSIVPERPRFADGQWRYLAMPGASGEEVARRLTEIGPPQNSVVVSYDGSSHNTFHVWYRGQGTSTRYTYAWGRNSDLADPPRLNFFLSEPGVIPAGIGGAGNTAVPIYFVATP